jgi:hypothetical protein
MTKCDSLNYMGDIFDYVILIYICIYVLKVTVKLHFVKWFVLYNKTIDVSVARKRIFVSVLAHKFIRGTYPCRLLHYFRRQFFRQECDVFRCSAGNGDHFLCCFFWWVFTLFIIFILVRKGISKYCKSFYIQLI